MLKQVALSDLELGMFIHKMEGGWFDHPFWKAKFLIEDNDRLETLKTSGLRGVVIDTSKGKDVSQVEERPAAAGAPARSKERIAVIQKRTRREERETLPVTIDRELHAAEAIAGKARESLNRAFNAARLGKALNVRQVEPVVHDIFASVRRNPQAFTGLMRCKLKNELMFRHALSVSALMVSLARKMKLSESEIHQCGMAGLVLDIGVNYLPRNLPVPEGDFRNLDHKVWQQHVLLGHRALSNDDDLPQMVLDACLQHHERFDGSGFPKGLAGQEIARVARMASICDSFDFLLSRTNSTAALDPAEAVRQMQIMEGAFDPDILRQFIESVGLYPVGSFVVLKSEKVAMVIDEDHKEYTRPVVQAFYSIKTHERILPHRIALARPDAMDEITGIADLSAFGFQDEAQLRELIFLSAHKMAA